MDAFPSKRKREYWQQRYAEQRDATKGRSHAERMLLTRHCRRFVDNIEYLEQELLAGYDKTLLPWLPAKDIINDRDDDGISTWISVLEALGSYDIDDYGMLVDMQDEGLRSSNRIAAAVWFKDNSLRPRDYMVRKYIYSPFPCEQWGRKALSLAQWRIIAMTLIDTKVRWQWTEGLNLYAESNGLLPDKHNRFAFHAVVGWNLVTPNRIYQAYKFDERDDFLQWTGNIIYTLAAKANLRPTKAKSGGQE